MCGQPAPLSVLRGLTASWWFYQINNLARRERPDADLESALDIEFQVVRR